MKKLKTLIGVIGAVVFNKDHVMHIITKNTSAGANVVTYVSVANKGVLLNLMEANIKTLEHVFPEVQELMAKVPFSEFSTKIN